MSSTRKPLYESRREGERQNGNSARDERERTVSRQTSDPRALDHGGPITPIDGLVQAEQPIAQTCIELSEILATFVAPTTPPGHHAGRDSARSVLSSASAID